MTYDDLMMAVLSMAAYAPLTTPKTAIGNATLLQVSNVNATDGFAAMAYSYNGKIVISYRGTDGLSDLWYGWGAGIGAETTQAGQAAEFYKSVAAQQDHVGTFPYSTNVVFTGHSLGGITVTVHSIFFLAEKF